MKKNVIIVGVGNLGSRYLQGLADCSTPLNIYLCEPSLEAINVAINRWYEVAPKDVLHSIHIVSLIEAPHVVDLAIIATNADIRPEVMSALEFNREVHAWVIEKIIAQSDEGMDAILSCTSGLEHVYINLPRCAMPWYQEIKDKLAIKGPKEIVVSGGRWGLACNSIHHLHLASFFTGESIVSVKINNCDGPLWYETKRKGFYDFFGTIEAEYSRGSRAILRCTDNLEEFNIKVAGSDQIVEINEARGLAAYSDGESIVGALQYQSQITAHIADSILSGKGCSLPKLTEIEKLQRILLTALRIQWNRSFDVESKITPVT